MPRIPLSPESRSARARIANYAGRGRPETDPDLTEARREFKASTLADHIRATVDEAPPLTPEQRDRLALLLRGGADR